MIALLASVRTFELRNVFTTKHPASVMMLGIEWRKYTPNMVPRGYRLIAAAYKDVLVTKILQRVRKITRNGQKIPQSGSHVATG